MPIGGTNPVTPGTLIDIKLTLNGKLCSNITVLGKLTFLKVEEYFSTSGL